MTIAYFDCFSGASGDMVLGALIDAGMPLARLKREISRLPVHGYKIILSKKREPIRGTNVQIAVTDHAHRRAPLKTHFGGLSSPSDSVGDPVRKSTWQAGVTGFPPASRGNDKISKVRYLEVPHNDYKSIDSMIAKSRLTKFVKELSRTIFEKIACAEAKIHGMPVNRVHFHEVGAVDSIVDIVGSAIGFDYFKFDSIHSSPLPVSRGRVKCAHGTFPLPAPATLEILRGIPIERTRVRAELVTPTGAAILATVAGHFGECPIQKIDRIGYGYGDRVFPGMPNALRIIIGQGFPVVVIECDIDDMNPQIFDYAMKKMFDAGAVDVNLIPIQMKKSRPAIRVSATAPWDKKDAVIETLLKETTTFGVRYWPAERKVLSRTIETKRTEFGKVRFKTGVDVNGNILKVIPECEDVAKIARRTGRPLIAVYEKLLKTRPC